MMMFAYALFAHLLCDFILQNDWMASNKMKWNGWKPNKALVVHSTIHGVAFGLLAFLFAVPLLWALVIGLGYGLVHFGIDSRRWVSGEKWPPKPIIVDQIMHLGQILIFLEIVSLWA